MSVVKVSLMEPRLRKVAGVNLHPGLQAISENDWAAMKKHPIGAQLIERGVIVERVAKKKANADVEPVAEPQEVEQEEAAKPVKAADLVAEIAETYDVARLRELSEDSRKTVSEAASEQLLKIEAL